MKYQKQYIVIEQVDRKLLAFDTLKDVKRPSDGWVHAIRIRNEDVFTATWTKALGNTTKYKGTRNERKVWYCYPGRIRQSRKALNMRLVYGFIPEEGSVSEMIEHQGAKLATQVVKRTSMSMKLEGQENSAERIERAIDELTEELKREMPRYLWD